MPRYSKQVQSGTDREGNPMYVSQEFNYRRKQARRPKGRKARKGLTSRDYKAPSSSASFFSALAIPRK